MNNSGLGGTLVLLMLGHGRVPSCLLRGLRCAQANGQNREQAGGRHHVTQGGNARCCPFFIQSVRHSLVGTPVRHEYMRMRGPNKYISRGGRRGDVSSGVEGEVWRVGCGGWGVEGNIW